MHFKGRPKDERDVNAVTGVLNGKDYFKTNNKLFKRQPEAIVLLAWGNLNIYSSTHVHFVLSSAAIYINKTEPHCRVTTTLLTTPWVSQLVLFQHHVTADHRLPVSLAGVFTWARRTAGLQVPPTLWFLSMRFPAASSSSFLQPLLSHQRPNTHYRPIGIFIFFVLYRILLPTGTAHGLHSLKGRDNLQLSPRQPALHFISPTLASRGKASAIRPPSPSVWPPCVISILSKSPKNSKFLLSCSL